MKYEPALDGLRAVAVTAVITSHIWEKQAPGGRVGVDVFFVLSGFLITSILQREALTTGRIDFGSFYRNRLLRLAPALVATVVTCVALSLITGRNPGVWAQATYSLFYVMNWARAVNGSGYGPLGHTWSLAVEEQFYLVWPLLLMICPSRHRLKATIGLVLFLIAWRTALIMGGASDSRLYNGFDTRAGELLVGCLLGSLFCQRPTLKVPPGIAALSFGTLLLTFRFGFEGLPLYRYWDNLAATVVSAAVLLSARVGLFQRLLSFRPLVFTGRISYGLYLWHPIVMFIAMPYAFRTDTPSAVNHILQFGVFVLSYVFALLSWYFIELPFLSMKRHSELARSEQPNSPTLAVAGQVSARLSRWFGDDERPAVST